MTWMTALTFLLMAGDASPGVPAGAGNRTHELHRRVAQGERICAIAPARRARPRAVRCRFECVCFRVNGYRCFRYYTESCDGRTCWKCQGRVTARARKSCSIGSPVRSCWCKFKKL